MADSPSRSEVVSVVIPVKDDGELLRRCLRALARQSRGPDEVVVVDNASVDASAEIARDAGARVVRCDRPGIAAASAAGYDAASGDLILRLDADCLPADDWVAEMIAGFRARPEVAVLTGAARFIDGPRWVRGWSAALYLSAYLLATFPALGHLPVFGSNLAFRRDAWHDVRERVHLDAELHDDLDLAFHFGERHRIAYARSARMGMSMRPLRSLSGFSVRMRRGVRTVVVHWPRDFPPARWKRLRQFRRVKRQRERGSSATTGGAA